MLDHGIGIAGLALTLIFGMLRYVVPRVPSKVSITGIIIGIFLIGLAAGLVISDGTDTGPSREPVKTALLRLHIYGDNRYPDRLAAENIFRWYYLKIMEDLPNSNQPKSMMSILFVTFDPEVRIGTMQVHSPDIKLPIYEVKEFNHRYAILVFGGDIHEGTLEVAVAP